jgi:hypothetical protein
MQRQCHSGDFGDQCSAFLHHISAGFSGSSFSNMMYYRTTSQIRHAMAGGIGSVQQKNVRQQKTRKATKNTAVQYAKKTAMFKSIEHCGSAHTINSTCSR